MTSRSMSFGYVQNSKFKENFKWALIYERTKDDNATRTEDKHIQNKFEMIDIFDLE